MCVRMYVDGFNVYHGAKQRSGAGRRLEVARPQALAEHIRRFGEARPTARLLGQGTRIRSSQHLRSPFKRVGHLQGVERKRGKARRWALRTASR